MNGNLINLGMSILGAVIITALSMNIGNIAFFLIIPLVIINVYLIRTYGN